ncbi:MAG: cytochrome bc complex cytochrome b subunit [Candidatus Melainabacteria bacterium]|nr:cytochrome bc complex cytochrome b subunit [Candidatus Melainabacteria bacterium]
MKWAYYLGGLTLLLFIIQLITGLLLLFYYQPTIEEAYDSVKFISDKVPGGAVIRNLHSWSSSIMVLAAIIHLLTTFAMKAFEKPREVTWWSGVFLLFTTFIFAFTGYLLPWHQLSVNATKVGLQFIGAVSPYLPGTFSELPNKLIELIQGGQTVGQETLSRFFSIHVVVLPLLIFGILGVHLLSVQLQGMSKGVDGSVESSEKFFPNFLIKDFSLWTVTFFILFVLAITIPFESFFAYPFMEPYNPSGSTPEGIKPEWYFFFVYYPMELLPFWIIILALTTIVIVLFLVPKIFAGTSRKMLTFLSILAFSYFVIMTIFGDMIFHLIKGDG